MNDPTMWASFVAALEPFGWAEYVHDGGYLSGDSLRHAESGAWARVTIKGDTLVTDGYPNDRSTKVRRFRDGTNDWPTTAKVWAERIGAQKVADRQEQDARRGSWARSKARMEAIALSLRDHLATIPGARPYVRREGISSAEVNPLMPGSVYGGIRLTGPEPLSVYIDDVSGTDLAGIVTLVDAVRRWRESFVEG